MGKSSINCCIVGCNNYYAKTRDDKVSYIGFPKQGTGNDEWRAKLIAEVSRADKGFNPANAKICSVHFKPTDLLFHGELNLNYGSRCLKSRGNTRHFFGGGGGPHVA